MCGRIKAHRQIVVLKEDARYEIEKKPKRMLEITCKLLVVQLLAEVTGISLAELLTQQLFVHWSIPRIFFYS